METPLSVDPAEVNPAIAAPNETAYERHGDASHSDLPLSVDPAEINPVVATPEERESLDAGETAAHGDTRSGYLPWLLLLLAVIAFGYLSRERREAIGTFVAQVADVIQDFRGYDPEV